MADFLIKVNIPVNGAVALHVIRGFFKKPEVKHREQTLVPQEADIETDRKDGGSNG